MMFHGLDIMRLNAWATINSLRADEHLEHKTFVMEAP